MASISKTLRLLMPQWQGGDNPTYQLGARLLAWLAPTSEAPLFEVPVASPEGPRPQIESGIFAKTALLEQTAAALAIINQQAPDRIVTFGGDCSVSLAPFSWLAAKYEGDVAVLWLDSHTDLTSSLHYAYAHGYPALNLLGQGDEEFAAFAQKPVPANRMIYVGVGKAQMSQNSLRETSSRGMAVFDPSELTADFSEVTEQLRKTGASKVLVHFDVDVLDPQHFRAQLFNNPDGDLANQFDGLATGKLKLDDIVRLLTNVGKIAEVVGLSITEHLPWDAENMRKALAKMPILSG